MQINVSIQLSEGDTVTQSSDAIAAAVLDAIGDPATDYCTVTVMQPIQSGNAGELPVPPPLDEPM